MVCVIYLVVNIYTYMLYIQSSHHEFHWDEETDASWPNELQCTLANLFLHLYVPLGRIKDGICQTYPYLCSQYETHTQGYSQLHTGYK